MHTPCSELYEKKYYIHTYRVWDKWRRTENSKTKKKKVQRRPPLNIATTTNTTTTSHITTNLPILRSDCLTVSSHGDISVTVPF